MAHDSKSVERTPERGAPSEIEQLRTLLYTDDLTGLYNRRFFRHCIAEQKNESDTTGIAFCLLMIDIDHFKQINDTFGHSIGDTTLLRVASVLKEELREKGWVFRYAGDEFVAILKNGTEERVQNTCSRILQRVSELTGTTDAEFPLQSLSASIGSAVYPTDTRSISELLDLADRALYASKHAGRNSFHDARQITERQTEQWPIHVQCQPLIGRQNQWNFLQHHFTECKNRHGRLLLITGEAGIGKSRLIRHFIRRQRVSEHHILFGECTEATVIHPYASVRDALRKGFEAKDPATVNVYKELSPQHRNELIALVPQFNRFEKNPLSASKSSDRYLLLESILLLLQGLAKQLPTVLVLEDIHWSDEATLSLLQYVARNIRNERILLLGTFRDEDAIHTNLPSVVQNMSRENLFERIALGPLNKAETTSMLDEIFNGYRISEEVKKWIYDETEGNPFYVEEFVKMLLEESCVERSGKNLMVTRPDKTVLPYSIRALIQRRISRLDDSLQRVLSCAAMIGNEFELNTLTKVLEENEGYLLDLLERLAKLQLIQERSDSGEDRFQFTHNKIRDVIYEDMGTIRRRKFHQQVGEILEFLHGNEIELYAEDLAYHFERAEETRKACTYSLEAGKKALQIHAYQDALLHLKRSYRYNEEHPGELPVQAIADLFTAHGEALEALGRWEEAIQFYEQLFQLKGDGALFLEVDALSHLSRVFYKRENFSKSLMLAQQALDLAKAATYRPGICTAYHSIGKNYWRLCNYETALKALLEAIETSEQLADRLVKARLLNSAGIVQMEMAKFAEAITSFEQALNIFQHQNHKQGVIECLVNISIIRHLQGDLHQARQYCINAYALAQETGDPVSVAACCVNQAELEFKLANYEIGKRLNERAFQIYSEIEHAAGLTYAYENEGYFSLLKGHLKDASEAMQKALAIAEEKNLTKRTIELLKTETAILSLMGNYNDAIDLLNRWDIASQKIQSNFDIMEAKIKRGFVYVGLDDLAQAALLWNEALESAESNPPFEFLFWKTAAASFLACVQKNEKEMVALQTEMRGLADRAELAYFIIGSHLLSSYQFSISDQWSNALKFAEEAEKQATYYGQDVWKTRATMSIFELRHHLKQSPGPQELYQLLETAKEQRQSHIVHRCYRLLWELDPEFEKSQQEWLRHWALWQKQIPKQYHDSLRPAIEDY